MKSADEPEGSDHTWCQLVLTGAGANFSSAHLSSLNTKPPDLAGRNPAMLGPPARSPVIVRGERHSHAEASSASRLGARRRCGWIHYCVRRAAFKRLGIKRPFLLMFGSLSSSCGKRHSEAWAPCALFPRLSSPYMLYPKAQ